jgi:hypothetical protein
MEEKRRNEEAFIRQQREAEERNRRQQQEFMMRANQPYNFAEQGNNDMYGASNPGYRPSNVGYGQGQGNVGYGQGQGNVGYGQGGQVRQANVSYGQAQTGQVVQPANFNTTGQSMNFSTTEFNTNSHNRPPVVHEGGCCCTIM